MIPALALQQVGLRELILGIPHDVEAIVVYAVLIGFIGFIWLGTRTRAR